MFGCVSLHRDHSAEASAFLRNYGGSSVGEHFHLQGSLWVKGCQGDVHLQVEHDGIVFVISYFSFGERHGSVVDGSEMLFVSVEPFGGSCVYRRRPEFTSVCPRVPVQELEGMLWCFVCWLALIPDDGEQVLGVFQFSLRLRGCCCG